MGFIAAIPIGATQIEIAKRLLHGYIFSAIMIVAGAVTSDFTYGVIALFGIAPFLQGKEITAIFALVNSAILIVLGIFTLRQSRINLNEKDKKVSNEILSKKRVGYITGFLLAVANPVIIYWWVLGSRFMGSVFHIEKYTLSYTFLFLIAGTMGIASYPMTIFIMIRKTKKFFSPGVIRKTTFIFGLALFGLAAYFLYDGLKYFM